MRQISEILENMDTVQATYPVLSGLTSTSDTAWFGSVRQMWAHLHQDVEASWDTLAANLDVRLSESKVGGPGWYVDQAKLFQIGDAVDIINGKVAYAVVDEEKQIVKQAAISENLNGRLMLRVAKKWLSGLAPLSADELSAVKAYVMKFKMAGVIVDVTSLEADHVKLAATVKVDRQIISPAGVLLADGSTLPVNKAIEAYLSAIPYDSIINNTALTDVVQQVPGVKDFSITGSFTRRPSVAEWIGYATETLSTAGYGVLHADSMLTYTY